ncbi:MAG TPA: efflux RND transporter periplasmic adaptor subunit [Flavobacteriales bacterium]|nr:efflux RND transporter periplasmic adaptor subunit [Flavobacteriales bacterium]
MKNTIHLLTLVVLLSACGATTPTDDLGRKRAELDSLKAVYKELGLKIKETETWVAEHDTTVRRNLPTVTTLVLQPSTFEHFVQVHGAVKADKSADLFAMGGGRVRRVLVKEGDRVHSGQLLVDLDNDAIDKQIAAAESGAALAKDVFDKQSKLWEQKIGSEMQYLQARSQKEQAEASLAALREQRRMSQVTAPFDGTVDQVMVSIGDMTGMSPVARVVDASGAQLEADVPESYLTRVKVGDPVRVEFPSLGDTIMATLSNVSKYIDPANRTFRITVRVPEANGLLRPNLLSVIHIRDQVQEKALVVPSRTIQEDVNGNNYIFLLDDAAGRKTTRKVMVKRMADYRGSTMIVPAQGDASELGGAILVDEGAKSVGGGQEVKVTKL